jgi:DinB superfamily
MGNVKETIDQYKTRILGYAEGKDALATQRATPIRLARLTRGLSRAQLAKKSAPDTWSIGEILAHLSETEMVVGWRLRQALTKSGTSVHAYDQDDWARVGRYAKRDPRKSLALFTALRECNLSLLKGLSKEQWDCYHMHQERGRETVAHTARMIAGHDLNHLLQIERIRRDTLKKKR